MAVTQEQIATLAGVSRGTVDRTLNNRGRVHPDVAARIRQIAGELGYQPNRAGKLLALAKSPIRLGVVIQSVGTAFMRCIWDEVEAARPRLRDMGAELVVRTLETVDEEEQISILDELEQEGIDGLSLSPCESERVFDKMNALAKKIPVITFNTDMPGSKRLCYVGQDNYASGRACAGLMGLLLGGQGRVLMVTGHLFNLSHQRRIDAFRSEIMAVYPNISLFPMEKCNDDSALAYEIVSATLKKEQVSGIYIAANGQSGACAAIRDCGMQGRVRLICHDLTEENAENVRAGLIDFLVDQDARAQAVRPLELLVASILNEVKPPEEFLLTRIDLRNRYNI